MTRIAFVSDELPVPGVAGHLAYNHAVLAWLAGRGAEVVVVLVGMRWARPVVRYGLFPVVGPHVTARGAWVAVRSVAGVARVVGRVVRRRLGPRAAGAVLGDVCGAADARWVRGWVRRAGVEAVLVDTVFRAPVLGGLGVNAVLLAHDVFHERAAQLAALGLDVRPAGFTAAAEAALAGLAPHIAAIQPDEAEVLARLCPAANVFAAPMPALPCPPPAGRRAGAKLVFLGSAAPANLAGLRWFLARVWPLVAGVTLELVGDAGPALGPLPAGVRALGRVADLAAALHGADLAIAPLPRGSGLKIKLLDYARHGLTTIATPAAVAGFAPGGPFIVAQTPAAFAAAIGQGLRAPPAPAAALAYIAAHYAPEACFAPLAAALNLPREPLEFESSA